MQFSLSSDTHKSLTGHLDRALPEIQQLCSAAFRHYLSQVPKATVTVGTASDPDIYVLKLFVFKNITCLFLLLFPFSQGEFVEDGTETHFTVADHSCCIKAVSSGKRKEGIIHTLIVDSREIPEAVE